MKLPSKSYENTALVAALLHAAYPAKQALFSRSQASARPAPVVRVSRSTFASWSPENAKKVPPVLQARCCLAAWPLSVTSFCPAGTWREVAKR